MEEQQLDKRQLIAFLKATGLQKDFRKGNLEHYQQLYNVYIDANRKGFNLKLWNEEKLHTYLKDYEQKQLQDVNDLNFNENIQDNE